MTFVDISEMRADFCMKFYLVLSTKIYPLAPSFVKIYLKRFADVLCFVYGHLNWYPNGTESNYPVFPIENKHGSSPLKLASFVQDEEHIFQQHN